MAWSKHSGQTAKLGMWGMVYRGPSLAIPFVHEEIVSKFLMEVAHDSQSVWLGTPFAKSLAISVQMFHPRGGLLK